jgi:hypothetical protein
MTMNDSNSKLTDLDHLGFGQMDQVVVSKITFHDDYMRRERTEFIVLFSSNISSANDMLHFVGNQHSELFVGYIKQKEVSEKYEKKGARKK